MNFFYKILKVCIFAVFAQSVGATENFTIAVASNFLLPLNALKEEFEAKQSVKVNVVSASTSKLYAQIKNGAPFDVFLSADRETVNLLIEEGSASIDNAFLYARGQLVFWKPDAKDARYEFEQGIATKLVIANPRLAPYGKAALEVLNKNVELSGYKRKLIYAENISQAFQYVYQKNVDAGFVAYSQLKALKINSGYWLVPDGLYTAIDQYGILLNRSDKRNISSMFIEFLKNKDTQKKLISEFGYKSFQNEQESSR